MRRIVIALIGSIGLLLATRASAGWVMPEGMQWKKPADCDSRILPLEYMQGCYYGPIAGAADEHTGSVFYRICDQTREEEPFLIVDWDKHTYSFNLDPQMPLETKALSADGSIDPEPFLDQVNAWRGFCGLRNGNI